MVIKCIYLEAGSGADSPVPDEMVRAVAQVRVPVIVGGGIRTPETAAEKVQAGASFIVTGNIIEQQGPEAVNEFARAIHSRDRD